MFSRLFKNMVRVTGLEPAHRVTLEPKSSASANSATPATARLLYNIYKVIAIVLYKKIYFFI